MWNAIKTFATKPFRPYQSMNSIEIRNTYSETDLVPGYFATPSYIEQAREDPMELVGRGFVKRQNKNVKTARIYPDIAETYDGLLRLENNNMDFTTLDQNSVALQMDYMQDVYQRYYREDIFRLIKERLSEIPRGKVLKLSLFLVLTMEYFSTRSFNGNPNYEANSGKRAQIIRLRNTDADIYQRIDELWDILRDRLEQQLNEYVPGLTGSGWIIKSHRFMDINMDFVSDSFIRSYIPSDDFVKKSLINVQNEDDDYCLLYCYLKHKEHLENPIKRLDYRRLNVRKKDELLEAHPELEELTTTLPHNDKQEFKIKMKQIEAILEQNINVIRYKVCVDESYLSSETGKHDWFIGEGNIDGGYYTSFFDNKNNIYQENRQEVLNLLMMVNEEGYAHFAYIKNLDALFYNAFIKDNNMVKVCERTLYYDKTRVNQEQWYLEHDCHEDGCERMKKIVKKQRRDEDEYYSDEDDEPREPKLRFRHYKYLLENPVYIVADFESSLISVNEDSNTNTRKVDKHSVNSYGFSIQSKYDLELEQETFMYVKTDESETEDTVISRFLESLQRQVRYINFKLQNYI